MTVTARVRPPSAAACTQRTVARTRTAVVGRRTSVRTGGGHRAWGTGSRPAYPPALASSAPADFDWVWDDLNKSSATLLSCDNRKVNFHMEYSCGTAAIRGTKELGEGQHFWEIKMTSPVYGTDMVSGQQAGGSGAGRCDPRRPGPRHPLPAPLFPDGGHRHVRRGSGQVPPHILQPARQRRRQLGSLVHGYAGP